MKSFRRHLFTILFMGLFSSIFGCSKQDQAQEQPSWPFNDPENCATISMRQVMDGREPILLVVHDDDDLPWQFIGTSDASEEDGVILGLGCVYGLDPSIGELADLPVGWQATRDSRDAPWVRSKSVDIE